MLKLVGCTAPCTDEKSDDILNVVSNDVVMSKDTALIVYSLLKIYSMYSLMDATEYGLNKCVEC